MRSECDHFAVGVGGHVQEQVEGSRQLGGGVGQVAQPPAPGDCFVARQNLHIISVVVVPEIPDFVSLFVRSLHRF